MVKEKFKVGTRIKAIKEHDSNEYIVGVKGTIKKNVGNYSDVEFDKNIHGHNCNGLTKEGHGWVCPNNILVPINETLKQLLED